MKNTMKKLLNLLLVAMMVFSMSATAFAATPDATNKITINPANAGHTYTAYQIFAGDLSESGETLSTIKWGAQIADAKAGSLLTALRTAEIIGEDCTTAAGVAEALSSLVDDSEGIQKFAKVVGDWLVTEDPSAYGEASDSNYNTNTKTYTFNNVAPGYYLIMDSIPNASADAASRYIVKVAGKDVAIAPKGGSPTVEKKVLEDTELSTGDEMTMKPDQGEYNDVADWEIGQTKSFKLYAHLPAAMWDYNQYYVQFNDSYVKGITVDISDYKVTYIVNEEEKELPADTFTAENTAPEGETKGALTFTCENIKTALKEAGVTSGEVTIAIEYKAELNKDAVVGFGGNVNDVYLKYSSNPNNSQKGQTAKDEVIVFTFALEGTKIDGNSKNTITGVEFKLGNEDGKWATLEKVENAYFLTGWVDTKEAATPVVTDDNGLFTFKGLDSDTYILSETKTADGYNSIDDITITITSKKGTDNIYTQNVVINSAIDGLTTTIGTVEDETVKLTIENKKGSTLPDTGDTGSLFFYAFGALGSALCIILLITKKRMNKYKSVACGK